MTSNNEWVEHDTNKYREDSKNLPADLMVNWCDVTLNTCQNPYNIANITKTDNGYL